MVLCAAVAVIPRAGRVDQIRSARRVVVHLNLTGRFQSGSSAMDDNEDARTMRIKPLAAQSH